MNWTATHKEMAFASGLGLIGLALLVRSNRIVDLWPEPLGPKLYPMIVSGGLIMAAVWALFDSYRRNRRAGAGGRLPQAALASGAEPSVGKTVGTWRRPAVMGLLCVLYLAGQKVLGFYVATALFLLATMVTLARFASEPLTWRAVARSYVPLTVGWVIALYAAARLLSMYIPEGGLLF